LPLKRQSVKLIPFRDGLKLQKLKANNAIGKQYFITISFEIILWQNIPKQQKVWESNKSVCHI
jgi:hypothetical protein